MEIEKETREGKCIIALKGRLDAVTSPELDSYMGQVIDKGNLDIVLNLNGLDYLSSAGLRVFLVATKKIKAVKGELSLAGLTGNIKPVLTFSGFPTIMPCYDTIEEALE